MFTDAFKYTVHEDTGLIEIVCKNISVSGDIDESLIGANKSAEEADEGTEENSVTGIDVVIQNRLQNLPKMTGKEFMVGLGWIFFSEPHNIA